MPTAQIPTHTHNTKYFAAAFLENVTEFNKVITADKPDLTEAAKQLKGCLLLLTLCRSDLQKLRHKK